jgi:hypothetical protein
MQPEAGCRLIEGHIHGHAAAKALAPWIDYKINLITRRPDAARQRTSRRFLVQFGKVWFSWVRRWTATGQYGQSKEPHDQVSSEHNALLAS